MDLENFIWSDEYDGVKRKLYHKVCLECGKDFLVPKHRYDEKKYCSLDCANKGQRIREIVTCSKCQKPFERIRAHLHRSKTGLLFCSRKCKDEAQSLEGGIEELQPDHYGDGLSSYRQRAIKHYGAVCSVCGYKEYEQMLDVDHINSDRSNASLENLQVLCVWCHALKTRGVLPHKQPGA